MFQQAKKEESPNTLGLYIHIPFCRSKCDYCDFYSLAGAEGQMEEYQRALLTHIRQTAPLAGEYVVDTIYFGGGTPSYYGAQRLIQLLRTIREHFCVGEDAEITAEANPDSVDAGMLTELRRAGFNRISLGMQSACPGELKTIHRPHSAAQVDRAAANCRKAGFDNLSLDLIYGLPGQTMASWQESLEHALSLDPEHLSCYGLKVEEGTPLFRRVEAGEQLPDDDTQADLYLWTVERLERAGYPQYEISNFARPGFHSRHNLRYWLTSPYMGFGPGAHSDFGGERYSIVRDLNAYVSGVFRGEDILDGREVISREERGEEYLMLRLRTTGGISEEEYKELSPSYAAIQSRLEEFAARGWAVKTQEGRWRLTAQGFLLSNQLIGDLLQCGAERR